MSVTDQTSVDYANQVADRQKPIRVAQVVGKMGSGGVESVVMNYYRHIDRNKVQFDFVVNDGSTQVPREEIEALGGRVFSVPRYKNLPAYLKAMELLLRRIQPDIVHSHINALSVFPLRAAKRAGVQVRIAHSHSTSNPREHVRNLVKDILRPFSRVYPTAYAACSKYAASWLFGTGMGREGHVYIMRNALELPRFVHNPAVRAAKRAELGVEDFQLVVGQVGRMCSQKNQMFTLEAFSAVLSECPDAVLLFIGEGDDLAQIQAHANDLGISDHVRFLGVRDDVADFYQAFDVLAFPSLYEGLGMAAVEAQTADLPVVMSTEVPDEAILLKDLITVLPLDAGAQAWGRALIEAADRKPASTRVNRAEEISAAGYEIQASADQLADWYETLVRDRGTAVSGKEQI